LEDFPGMLDAFMNYIASLNSGWFYLALFVSAYVENIFPPVPGDTVTVFAAYLVGRSQERFLGVFIFTSMGSIAGFMTYYALGRLIHPEYFQRKNFRFFPASNFKTAENWFKRYGYWIVLLNRFLSGIRSVISIVCGIYRLPWLHVLILTSIGCFVWNGLLIWAGYLLGSNWRMIEAIMQQYSKILLCLLILACGIWLIRKWFSLSQNPK
jgi:membrane protein DedA with SNARE-associated domain